MSLTRYKVLIIGCGNIAGGLDISRARHLPPLTHAGAYTQHGGFSLVGCVDPDVNQRRAFARRWGVERHFSKLTDLDFPRGTIDVISICSPTASHYEHLVRALDLHPRVIFCEKPLTTDVATTLQLVKDCSALGTVLIVNYSRRWDPSIADVIDQLKRGEWGIVRSIVGHYNKGILNNGSHMIDLLLRLVGPLELVATTSPRFDFAESDPTVAALLTAANGSVPVYLNPAHARDFSYFEIEIVCELGVLRMQSGGMFWQFREVMQSPHFNRYRTVNKGNIIGGRYMESMALAIENIFRYLHSGVPPDHTTEGVVLIQELCARIQSNARVSLNLR